MTLGGSGARTTADTAYDPANDVYLVVTGSGPVLGVFVNAMNQPVTGAFTIYDGGSGFGHFPRARYSPQAPNGIGGAGGFLVVWNNGNGTGNNSIRGRVVAYAAGAPRVVTGIQTFSNPPQGSALMENRPVLAYSPTSQRYLIAWTTEPVPRVTAGYAIQGRFADAAGTPLGGLLVFELALSRDPALTWNAATDEFGLGNTGFNGTPYAQFRRVRPFDGATFAKSTFGFAPGTYATGIDVNSANQFVLTWGLAPGTRSAVFDANGTMLVGPTPVGSTIGGDLSMGLAYNPVSGTFLAVSSSWTSMDIAAVEINPWGTPRTAVTEVTSGGSLAPSGSYYPLVTARTAANHWNVVHSRGYLSARNQIVASGGPTVTPTGPAPAPGGCATADPFLAIGGGSCVNGGWVPRGVAPAPPPPPPPPPPPSAGCTMPDPFVAIGGGTCVNGGWIPRGAAPAPVPVPVPTPPLSSGCSTPDPFASIGGGTCVNGGWVPTVSLCATPDPFVSIGGGICVNHGWIPRTGTGGTGCATPDPFTSLGGGTCVNGGWVPRTAMNLRQSPLADPIAPVFIARMFRRDDVRRPPDGAAVPA
jgi:hypothetical protein